MKKHCNICKYQAWSIGIGQGVSCTNNKNKGTVLKEGYGIKVNGRPLIPTRGFVCKHFKPLEK